MEPSSVHWMMGRGCPKAAGRQYQTSSVYTGGLEYTEAWRNGLMRYWSEILLILEWVKVLILQLGTKEKAHIVMAE